MAKNFTIAGVKEIQRAYRELPKAVAGKVVRQAIRKALTPVLAEAKRRAPVSRQSSSSAGAPGRDSQGRFVAASQKQTSTHTPGLLRKSIRLRARAKKKRGVIAMDVRVGEGDFKGATYYAAFQEFGTKTIKAKNYMAESFEATEDRATNSVREQVSHGILNEAKKLARG